MDVMPYSQVQRGMEGITARADGIFIPACGRGDKKGMAERNYRFPRV